MARNVSVEEYKRRCMAIPPAVKEAAYARLVEHGQKMANTMKAAAPRKTGKLANSIVLETDAGRLRIAIKAGGKATTTEVRKGSGVSYDYARGQEFGTVKMQRNPFFWPIYRLLKKSMRSAVKRSMTKAIKAKFPTEGGNV